ncbi:MAG TPA: acyltransferase [Candidatus Thermoplasmatota archaeon]|nr:acyltransferase [Candidatus Thermoplasmatota archaeon]
MSNDRAAKKIDFSFTSVSRLFVLIVVVVLCYACAFFIPIVFLYEVTRLLHFSSLLHLFLFSLAVVVSYLLLVFSMILFSTIFIRVLRVRYTEGVYGTTIKDKTSFKFILSYALYFPTYKVIGFLNMPPIKVVFLKMIGCKIGRNVVLAADEWIFDPYVTEIGDNTTIGARSIITGHIGEGGRVYIKKVRIGNMVLIGGDAMIMPGVTIEDNVVVGAKSLVLKDQVLKQGKVYAGIPAREIASGETIG